MKRRSFGISVAVLLLLMFVSSALGVYGDVDNVYASGGSDITAHSNISNLQFNTDEVLTGSQVTLSFNFSIDDSRYAKGGNYICGTYKPCTATRLGDFGLYNPGAVVSVNNSLNEEIGKGYIEKDGNIRIVFNDVIESSPEVQEGKFHIEFNAYNNCGDSDEETIRCPWVRIGNNEVVLNVVKPKAGQSMGTYYKTGAMDEDRSHENLRAFNWAIVLNEPESVKEDNPRFIQPIQIDIDGKKAYEGLDIVDEIGLGHELEQIQDFNGSINRAHYVFYGIRGSASEVEGKLNAIFKYREMTIQNAIDRHGINFCVRDNSEVNDGYSYIKIDNNNILHLHLNAIEWAYNDDIDSVFNSIDITNEDLADKGSSFPNDVFLSEELIGKRIDCWGLSYSTKSNNIGQMYYSNNAPLSIQTEGGIRTIPASMKVRDLSAGGSAELVPGVLQVRTMVEKNGVYYKNKPLEGIEYELRNADTNALVASGTTNENGDVFFRDLDGKYILKQVSTPRWLDVNEKYQSGVVIEVSRDKGAFKTVGEHIRTLDIPVTKEWDDEISTIRPDVYLKLRRSVDGDDWEDVPGLGLIDLNQGWNPDEVKRSWKEVEAFNDEGELYSFDVVEVLSDGSIWDWSACGWCEPVISVINHELSKRPEDVDSDKDNGETNYISQFYDGQELIINPPFESYGEDRYLGCTDEYKPGALFDRSPVLEKLPDVELDDFYDEKYDKYKWTVNDDGHGNFYLVNNETGCYLTALIAFGPAGRFKPLVDNSVGMTINPNEIADTTRDPSNNNRHFSSMNMDEKGMYFTDSSGESGDWKAYLKVHRDTPTHGCLSARGKADGFKPKELVQKDVVPEFIVENKKDPAFTTYQVTKEWVGWDDVQKPEVYFDLQRRVGGGEWEEVPNSYVKPIYQDDKVVVSWHNLLKYKHDSSEEYEYRAIEVVLSKDEFGDDITIPWDSDSLGVEVSWNSDFSVCTNTYVTPVNLRIHKVGEDLNNKDKLNNLEGAEFKILKNEFLDGSGEYKELQSFDGSEFITDANGFVTFTGLYDGFYKIIETRAPCGYQLADCIIVEIKDSKFRVSDDCGNTWREQDGLTWHECDDTNTFEFTLEDGLLPKLPVSGSSSKLILKTLSFLLAGISGLFIYFSFNAKEVDKSVGE